MVLPFFILKFIVTSYLKKRLFSKLLCDIFSLIFSIYATAKMLVFLVVGRVRLRLIFKSKNDIERRAPKTKQGSSFVLTFARRGTSNIISLVRSMDRARFPYTVNEYVQMVHFYYVCNGVLEQAARAYRARWPNRQHPDPHTIGQAYRRFSETGNVLPDHHVAGRPRVVLNPAMEDRIIRCFDQDPTTSTRAVGRQLDLFNSQVHSVIREAGRHPYHYRPVQDLLPADFQHRVNFCGGLLAQLRVNDNFLDNILFTDECMFTKTGMFNQHNYHYWAEENTHLTRVTNVQHRWSLNVWAGMLNGQLVSGY